LRGVRRWNQIKHQARAWARTNTLQLLPIRHELAGYSTTALGGDLRAALNVALLAFPQGMAYAAIAGLPIAWGIFGSALAAIVGPLVSGSRFIVLGPTNATAVLVFAGFAGLGLADPAARIALLPVILALSGAFLILGAFLRVANLIQYISRSVVTGYITAAALYIIVNQCRKVLGFSLADDQTSSLFAVIHHTLTGLPRTHLPSLVLGLLTAAGYFLLNRRWPKLPNVAIALIGFTALGVAWDATQAAYGWFAPLASLDAVRASDWSIHIPRLSFDLISQVSSLAFVLAFLCVLEGTSIGKSLASRSGKRLDANQEMLGIGVANLACAVGQGLPASGSLTRSQLNWNSGAATALASVFSGALCIAAVFGIGAYTRFIPESVLAVLVIFIGLSLINRHVIRVVWRTTKSDRIVFVTTLLAALLIRLDFAIILGAGVSILLFLRQAAQPELIEYSADLNQPDDSTEISIVHVEGDLFFGAAELFRDQMRRVCERPNLKVVILKLRNAYHLDATSMLALEELTRTMRAQNRLLLVSEARKEAVRMLKRSGIMDVIGRDNIFPDNRANPTLATSRALRHAQRFLGGQTADIRIFLGSSQRGSTKPQ
jgi:sulfate permease, SulP family